MATWLSRPIMRVSLIARMSGAKCGAAATVCGHGATRLCPPYETDQLYRQHLHQAYRLLAPVCRDGGAHAALDRLLDRLRVAAAALGQVLEGVDRCLVGDLEHRLAVGVCFRNADELDLRIGEQVAAIAERKRDHDDAGKAQAPAVSDGAYLRRNQQRAVLVEAGG